MPLVAGIDCGTGFTKAVIITGGETHAPARILGRGRAKSGVDSNLAASNALRSALQHACIAHQDLAYVATTGFGRYGVSFRDIQITEITSAARGAYFLCPETTTILDIGSQTTRAVASAHGRVKAFKSNDKCAAGSGMFITRAAKYLEVPLEQVGELSLHASRPQPISSICAVLAESEIINHVSLGVSVEDILRGIHDSLAERAGMLLKRVGMGDAVTFIGGVAQQAGIVRALQEKLKVKVTVPEGSEYACALGASLLGLQRYSALRSPAKVGTVA
jgi:(R)-2-hydroxyacyl-CoA dehydratese activating ATPase